jgi:micrococcal nuclease
MAALLASGTIAVHVGDPRDSRRRDRYGRTLATTSVNDRDAGEVMIAEGLARPWDSKRQSWCD